jgi:phosphotransferase system HPr (HPr) family protein
MEFRARIILQSIDGDDTGLHARPTHIIWQKALEFEEAEIHFSPRREDRRWEVNGKSFMHMLTLALPSGSTLYLRCSGPGAEAAFLGFQEFFTTQGNEFEVIES